MQSRREFLRYSALTAAYLAVFGLGSVVRAASPGAESRIEALRERLAKGGLPSNERLNALLKLAREYHLAGRPADEAATLKDALAMEDLRGFRERFARFNYGKALYRRRDHVGAMLVLETLAEEPFRYRAEVLVVAARAAIAAKDRKRAEAFVGRLLEHYPGTLAGEEGLYLRGALEMRLGRPKHAAGWFEKSVEAAEARRKDHSLPGRQPLLSRYLALIGALLASGRARDAEGVLSRLLALSGRDPMLELETRYRAALLYWKAALAREVARLVAPVPGAWERVGDMDKPLACQVAPKAMTLGGLAWRALGDRDRALECFATGRALAVVPGGRGAGARGGGDSPESEIVHPLKAQAEMALQEEDDLLLQETLSEGDEITQDSLELRELYDVEVGKTLQKHGHGDWIPMSEEVADGGFASAGNRLQENKDLARNARLSGDHSAAADRVAQSLAAGALAENSQAEFDTRLLLVGDLAAAGRLVERDAQLALIDSKIAALDSEPERRWWKYRAGRALLKTGDAATARGRLLAVRSDHPGSREAKKALFALADLEEKEGSPEDALGHYLDYIQSHPGEKPYILQAAHRAYELAAQHPGMLDVETLEQLVDTLVADLSDTDWRALMRAAQFLHRRGDESRAHGLMARALAAMEAERLDHEIEPLTEPWVSAESRYVNALYQMARHADIVARVEDAGLADLYDLLAVEETARGVFTMLFLYACSLVAVGRGTDAATARGETQTRSAALPERMRAALEAHAIHDVWHAQSFADAEPLIHGFIRTHPSHFQSYNFLLLWALALITDGNDAGALEKIEQAERFRPMERGPASQHYLANIGWLKGFCLDRLGQAEGAALMEANKPRQWVVATAQNGLPRR